MINFLKTMWQKLRNVFGLHRNSKYVANYLNDANMRSGVFMSAVIIVLETWLIIRQTHKYVIPRWNNASYAYGPGQVMFMFWFNYVLLLFFGLSMLIYCLNYKKMSTKKRLIISLAFAGFSALLCFLLPVDILFTNSYNAAKNRPLFGGIDLILLIVFYASIFLFNIAVILSSIYKFKGGKRQGVLSVAVITLFALTCLAFGIKISYSDFAGMVEVDGEFIANPDYKGIICFLMMSIYVGCLLIWKPYVSLGILGAVFIGFYLLLKTVTIRKFPEGDEINYITFFISLTMICISIYDQRVSEAKKDEELELLATKDTLTGLWSFEYFITLVTRKIKEENIKHNEYIYLFMNITSFKIYNDQKGFDKGNEFLKEVGVILTEVFRGDLVTRQSDDHFVVFAKNIDIESKLDMVNMRTEKQDLDIRPGVKTGEYQFRDEKEGPHQSVEKARYACAELEAHGVGNFLRYDSEMHDNYRMVQYIVRHVDEAIEKGYIKAFYQPVVWSKGRKLCGAEALARWIDPKYGFLSPGKFVPALENSQLIYKLDIAILRLVCKQLRESIDKGEPAIPVSINFSRIDFNVVDIVTIIDDTIKEFNISPDLLHIEITESALMSDEAVLKSSIKRLHELGYAVWLDDFGSGYSSFNVLKDYEFDVLKLDMAFLIGFENNQKAKFLIESVVQMAEQIGMKTLSEGVETKEEAAFLESISCGRLQGYLYSKPIPYEELKGKIDNGEFVVSKELITK